MIGGVNFQPGGGQNGTGETKPGGNQGGVQEAIRVLSLRLPKVVGAQSAAAMPLLTSQGSGGNSRVDSIVQQIMSRIGGNAPSAPMMPAQTAPDNAPSFSGSAQPNYQPQSQPSWMPPPGFTPRIVITDPLGQGDFTTGPDGRPSGGVPGAIEQAPFPGMDFPLPSAPPTPSPWERLGKIFGGGGSGYAPPDQQETPMF